MLSDLDRSSCGRQARLRLRECNEVLPLCQAPIPLGPRQCQKRPTGVGRVSGSGCPSLDLLAGKDQHLCSTPHPAGSLGRGKDLPDCGSHTGHSRCPCKSLRRWACTLTTMDSKGGWKPIQRLSNDNQSSWGCFPEVRGVTSGERRKSEFFFQHHNFSPPAVLRREAKLCTCGGALSRPGALLPGGTYGGLQ